MSAAPRSKAVAIGRGGGEPLNASRGVRSCSCMRAPKSRWGLTASAGPTASVPAGFSLVALRLSPVTLLACALRSRADGAPLAQHLEAERSGAGDRFDEADIDRVAKPVSKARILADEGM